MVDYQADPVELVPSAYGAWRERFHAERDRVRTVLSDAGLADAVVRIEHVGSTAVPDLAAKDVVDVDVVVADDAVDAVSAVLVDDLGGTRHRNHDGWHPVFREHDGQRFNDHDGQRFNDHDGQRFNDHDGQRFNDHDGQRFNDHVFARSDDGWKTSVATRDVLRADDDLRAEYERVKRDLASDHDDVEAYSRGKREIVDRLLERARDGDAYAFDFDVPR